MMNNGGNGSGTPASGAGGVAAGMLTVAFVVGIVTLMYAPQSGQQTRERLREEYNETQMMFQRWVDELKERLNRILNIMGASAEREVRAAMRNE
jgi:gas vesicle protein